MLCLSKRIGQAVVRNVQGPLSVPRHISITCRGKTISQDKLFEYTNGRFLVNEEWQCKKRYVRFNIGDLCDLVGSLCETASPVIAIEKLEGGFNKALLMKRADGAELIAKIPCRNAGPPHLTTASEVAVLDYIREHTSVPAPKVIAWNSDSSNPVGAEYIIMNKVNGAQLFEKWSDIDGLSRLSIIEQLVDIEREMASNCFPAFGNLYRSQSINKDQSCIHLDTSVDSSGTFYIGPSCDPVWQPEIGLSGQGPSMNGPWQTLSEYGLALLSREKKRIVARIPPNKPGYPCLTPAQRISVVEAAEKVMAVLETNPRLHDFGIPLLWHTDLHMGNIFVSERNPAKIESIIDWQSINIGPAFLQVRWPIFLEPPADYDIGLVKPTLPENFDELDAVDQDIAKYRLKQVNRTKAYETATFLKNRLTHDARNVHGLFKELFVRSDEAFEDGIIPLQECLIVISQSWNDLGFPKSSPIHFTSEEIEAHRRDYGRYQDWHDVQNFAREYLDTDAEGWLPPEVDYEKKLKQNRELFEIFLEQRAHGRTRKQLEQIWPFAAAFESGRPHV